MSLCLANGIPKHAGLLLNKTECVYILFELGIPFFRESWALTSLLFPERKMADWSGARGREKLN